MDFPPNPALMALEPFLGTWTTVGTHPQIPEPFHGQTTFAWHESKAFIIMRSHIDEDVGVPRGIAIIGSDGKNGTYSMIYYDSRGVSRTMGVRIEANVLAWWRDEPAISQRYSFTISPDGQMIVSKGEASFDGGPWQPDLDQTFTRLQPS
jgi:hypothetical protein